MELLVHHWPLSKDVRILPGGWPFEFPDNNERSYCLIRKIKKNTRSF